jgi:hypothetical protein
MSLAAIGLWALVIVLGVQTGAGIFETRVLVPLWSSNPPASVVAYLAQPLRPDSGRRLWIFLSPITAVIALGNLVLALMSSGPRRAWWVAGAGGGVAVLVATFAYFVPVLLSLPATGELPEAAARAKVKTWVALNYVRAAVLVAAWISSLKAFSYGLG